MERDRTEARRGDNEDAFEVRRIALVCIAAAYRSSRRSLWPVLSAFGGMRDCHRLLLSRVLKATGGVHRRGKGGTQRRPCPELSFASDSYPIIG